MTNRGRQGSSVLTAHCCGDGCGFSDMDLEWLTRLYYEQISSEIKNTYRPCGRPLRATHPSHRVLSRDHVDLGRKAGCKIQDSGQLRIKWSLPRLLEGNKVGFPISIVIEQIPT